MQISNRTIATLLIATIIVYLGGTFISLNRLTELGYPLTGFATSNQSGNVSVEILSTISITWTVPMIQWGSGYVDSLCNNCTMQVNNTVSAAAGTYGYDKTCCHTFNWSNSSLLLKNNGNQNVNLQMNVTSNVTNWFGTGAIPSGFYFKIVDVKTRDHDNADNPQDATVSCLGNNTHTNGWWDYEGESWTALDTWVAAPKYICGDANGKNFTPTSSANEANFDFKVIIPQNYTSTGVKTALITVLATS